MMDNKIIVFDTYRKRFWTKVDKDGPEIISDSPCWIWIGSKINQYGQFKTRKLKKNWLAHRFSWTITYGKIPKELFVLHKCDNGICVRPNHLFLGTDQDNKDDMVRKNRQAKGLKNGKHTHPESVPRGENHCNTKLNENDIRNIRKLYPRYTMSQIAKKHNITTSSAHKIIRKIRWKHVN